MGMKHIGKAFVDPLGSFIGYDQNPLTGGSKDEGQQREEMSEEDKEYIRRERIRQSATAHLGYKRGGSVKRKAKTRGCGCASSGTRKAKVY